MYDEFYLDKDSVPEIFLYADKLMEERYGEEEKQMARPYKLVHAPMISGYENGPIIVTEDWYFKKKREKIIRNARNDKDYQIEMIHLLSKKDRAREVLAELDPKNKKDAKKIAKLNIKIRNIDAQIKCAEELSGKKITELEHGTARARKVASIKRRVKKTVKKVTKTVTGFINRHIDVISSVASVALSVLGIFALKKLAG